MTTAHRPTWAPAIGGEQQGGFRMAVNSKAQSAKDMPSELTMKQRKDGQGNLRDVSRKDLRAELEANERKHFLKKHTDNFEEDRLHDLKLLESGGDGGAASKPLVPRAQDADVDDDDDDDDDGDEDEEAELLAELERIKAERAEKEAKEQAAAAEEAASAQQKELLSGNPLLRAGEQSFQVKRRWDDDVVFKNQARGEPKVAKRFINDTIRSDFHKRFLNRYIR